MRGGKPLPSTLLLNFLFLALRLVVVGGSSGVYAGQTRLRPGVIAKRLHNKAHHRPFRNKASLSSFRQNSRNREIVQMYAGYSDESGRRRRGNLGDDFDDLFDLIEQFGRAFRGYGGNYEDGMGREQALQSYEQDLQRIREKRKEADRLEQERTERLARENERRFDFKRQIPDKKDISISTNVKQYRNPAEVVPRLEMSQSEDMYSYTLDVQGMGREDLKLSMQDNIVIVEGNKMVKTDDGYHSHSFKRSFALPKDADLATVNSRELTNGHILIESKRIAPAPSAPVREIKIERIPAAAAPKPPSSSSSFSAPEKQQQEQKQQPSQEQPQFSAKATTTPPTSPAAESVAPPPPPPPPPPPTATTPPPKQPSQALNDVVPSQQNDDISSYPSPSSASASSSSAAAASAAPPGPPVVVGSGGGVDDLISLTKKTESSSSLSSSNVRRKAPRADGWEQVGRAWVLRPPEGVAWKAAVHFTGGAFASILPRLSYGMLLEKLAKRGVFVVATPYSTGFDYKKCVGEAFSVFNEASKLLKLDSDPISGKTVSELPVYGVGHSLGSVVQLLGGCSSSSSTSGDDDDVLQQERRKGSVLISFNNKPASEAVPMFGKVVGEEMSDSGMGSFAPMVMQALSSSQQQQMSSAMQSQMTQVNAMINMLTQNPSQIAQFAPMLEMFGVSADQVEELLPVLKQVQTLSNDMATGNTEFSPSREEIQDLVSSGKYQTTRNLLVRFADDGIDETPALERLLVEAAGKAAEDNVKLVVLPGGHTSPMSISMPAGAGANPQPKTRVVDDPFSSDFPTSSSSSRSMSSSSSSRSMSKVLQERDMEYLADSIVDWIEDLI